MNKVFIYFTAFFLLVFYQQTFSQKNSGYEAKAALLAQVSIFIEWPVDSSNKDLSTFFIIGLLNDDPFYPVIESMYKERTIKGKKVIIKRIPTFQDLENVHILFIPNSEKKNLTRIIRSYKNQPVLLFSDIEHFCAKGGHVHIYKDPKDFLLAINDKAIKQSGMNVSAQLLSSTQILRGN